MDQSIIESVTLEGVLPARQARSRQVVVNLLQAALKLLDTRDFLALSIADICEGAGVTAGAFYKRFNSKELFIEFLQRVVLEQTRHRMKPIAIDKFGHLSLREFLMRSVRGTLQWYREHEGFTRASLKYAQVYPDSWSPLRETGLLYSRSITPVILEIVKQSESRKVLDAIQFSAQMMIGTCNNMVLVNPGPYTIHTDKTVDMMVQAMALLIENAVDTHDKRKGA